MTNTRLENKRQFEGTSNDQKPRATVFWFTMACSILVAVSSGCGGGVPDYAKDLVDVTGKVTVDDRPIEGAVITFVAQTGPSRSSSAVTDAEGNYVMETLPAGPGVLPGSYTVVISKLEMPDGSSVPPDVPPMDVGATEKLPDQFSSFASPSLSAEVGSRGGVFPFELKTM